MSFFLYLRFLFNDSFNDINSRFIDKDDTLIVYTPAIPDSNNLLIEITIIYFLFVNISDKVQGSDDFDFHYLFLLSNYLYEGHRD